MELQHFGCAVQVVGFRIPKGSFACIWVFSKKRATPKWMVYKENPIKNRWFGGTTILGNHHTYIYIHHIYIYNIYIYILYVYISNFFSRLVLFFHHLFTKGMPEMHGMPMPMPEMPEESFNPTFFFCFFFQRFFLPAKSGEGGKQTSEKVVYTESWWNPDSSRGFYLFVLFAHLWTFANLQ